MPCTYILEKWELCKASCKWRLSHAVRKFSPLHRHAPSHCLQKSLLHLLSYCMKWKTRCSTFNCSCRIFLGRKCVRSGYTFKDKRRLQKGCAFESMWKYVRCVTGIFWEIRFSLVLNETSGVRSQTKKSTSLYETGFAYKLFEDLWNVPFAIRRRTSSERAAAFVPWKCFNKRLSSFITLAARFSF